MKSYTFPFIKVISFVSVLLINSMTLNAQSWGIIDSLSLLPSNPTSTDTIKVICKARFSTSYCERLYSNISVNNNVIQISSVHFLGNFLAICPSTDTVVFGSNFNPANFLIVYNLLDTNFDTLDIDTLNFTISSINNYENNRNKNLLYPNPVSDYAKFQLPPSNIENEYKIVLFNLVGQIIFTSNFKGNVIYFDRGKIINGIYNFQISADDYFAIGKIVFN